MSKILTVRLCENVNIKTSLWYVKFRPRYTSIFIITVAMRVTEVTSYTITFADFW